MTNTDDTSFDRIWFPCCRRWMFGCFFILDIRRCWRRFELFGDFEKYFFLNGEILVTWLFLLWDKLWTDIVESCERDDRLNMSKDLSSLMSTDNLHQRLFSETTTVHNVSVDHLEGQSESDNARIKRGMYECISMWRTLAEILSDLVHVEGNGIFRLP